MGGDNKEELEKWCKDPTNLDGFHFGFYHQAEGILAALTPYFEKFGQHN
jgi:hypothetical protein